MTSARPPSRSRAVRLPAVPLLLGTLGAAGSAVMPAFAQPAQSAEPAASAASSAMPRILLERVHVPGKRLIDISPMPGLSLTRDQVPANIQSATKAQIKASGALTIGDYMNTRMQGVSVNEYAGNPFQMDVNFRGFTASPQVGTPQGLSVFFDGVRVNEPFGDVVNWDLIPMNAIERFDLFPGSNPLFGLNTLGGAISVRSKSGFTAPGVDASLLGGSWGRRQLQLSGGANDGEFAGFAALNLFHEDGWRDDSPSNVRQFYGRGDWSLPSGTLTASVLGADNKLIGNGLIPVELYDERHKAVFTSPDRSRNKLLQFALSAAFDVSSTMNVTGKLYRRRSKLDGLNGDAYEDFQEFGKNDKVVDWERVNPALPICQFAQRTSAGGFDVNKPLNGPVGSGCGFVAYAPSPYTGQRRNGGFLSADGTQQEPGVVDGGTPIGLLTTTALKQVSDGFGLQANWNLERHKFMVGGSFDRSRADYQMSQRLGQIDAAHRVYLSPDEIAPQFAAAFTDVVGNAFDGKQQTGSLYFSELWSPQDNLHLSIAGRYNRTRVKTNLGTRSRVFGDIGDVRGSLPTYILCPSSDPSSCPSAPVAVLDPSSVQQTPTHDKLTYTSFNPSLGFNWLPTPALNLLVTASVPPALLKAAPATARSATRSVPPALSMLGVCSAMSPPA